MNPLIEFVKRAAGFGRIVAQSDLGIDQMARAQATGRVYQDGETVVALIPWDESTRKDRVREAVAMGPREPADLWRE